MGIFAVALLAAVVRVYPQSFEPGGWSLDAQFMDVMGSPYLLAHGLGERVCDARTFVTFPKPGKYRVWARTRNWADGSPGRFRVAIDGKPLDKMFGAAQHTWGWENGGEVTVGKKAEVRLQDLTGFDGRCAGLVFADDGSVPEGALSVERAPVAETLDFDFVVVGGGLPGTCAAVAAARRGLRVALVQDRPVLGGNASSEIGVHPIGEWRYPLVRELTTYRGSFPYVDGRRQRIVEDEPTLSLFLSTRVFATEKAGSEIASAKAVDLKTNRVLRFRAPLFCDATGDGWLGSYAGAEFRMGREAKAEFDESRAPEKADGETQGATILFRSEETYHKVPFSAPWAEPHAQGVTATQSAWYWEYGLKRDMIAEGEAIRDRLLLAIYGAFSRAKHEPKNDRLALVCPYLLGKRESRRLVGDWIFSERDVTDHRPFEDAIATGSWSIDVHSPGRVEGVDFLTRTTHDKFGRYYIPYRSIYSRNVPNLFMAGRCFSCTHVGLGSPRVMNTLSQLGVAAGEAAALCRERSLSPRGLYEKGVVRELQKRLGGAFPGVPDPKLANWIVIDDEDPDVRFEKGWVVEYNPCGEQVGQVSHFAGKWPVKPKNANVGDAVYQVPVKNAGRYDVFMRVPYDHRRFVRGSKTVVAFVDGGATNRVEIDQGAETGCWRKLGTFALSPKAELRILGGESSGTVIADGFGFVPAGDGTPTSDAQKEKSVRKDSRKGATPVALSHVDYVLVKMPDKSVRTNRVSGVRQPDGGVRYVIPAEKVAEARTVELHLEQAQARTGEDGYWVGHRGQLGYFTRESGSWSQFRNWATIPCYGMKTPRGSFLAVVDGLRFEHTLRVTATNGLYRAYPEWRVGSTGFGAYEDLSVIVYELPKGAGYNEMAKAFRKHKEAQDPEIKPIRERAKERPHLLQLSKSVTVRQWCAMKNCKKPEDARDFTPETEHPVEARCTFDQMLALLKKLKGRGVDDLYVCVSGWQTGGYDGRCPAVFPVEEAAGGEVALRRLVAGAKELGYFVDAHDNYTDCFTVSPMWNGGEVACRGPDGAFDRNGVWCGGQAYNLCLRNAWDVQGFMPRDLKRTASLGFWGCHYIDVFSCSVPYRCLAPRHAATAARQCDYTIRAAKLCRELFGGFASECCGDWLVGYLDYINYAGTAIRDFRKAKAAGKETLIDRIVPFWELAFHDVVLSNPDRLTQNRPSRQDNLLLVEFGGRPIFYRLSEKNLDDIVASAAQFKELSHLQLEEMTRHDELKPGLVRVRYGNGEAIYVNHADRPQTADGVTVPAQEYRLCKASL